MKKLLCKFGIHLDQTIRLNGPYIQQRCKTCFVRLSPEFEFHWKGERIIGWTTVKD
jgi:hypothetical protein